MSKLSRRCASIALLLGAVILGFVPPTRGLAGPVAQMDDQLVVAVTSPRPGERVRGRVEIAGYAADRRSTSGSGLNERDVAIYLDDPSAERNLLHYADAGRDSPEATAALGATFASAGFRAYWETCSFPPGPHRLYVWVSSLTTMGARQMAAVDIEVEPCAPAEIVFADTLQSTGRTVQLRGPNLRSVFLPAVRGDFAAAIDARCNADAVDCRLWLLFREQDGPGGQPTNSAYGFVIEPRQGTFGLVYRPTGAPGRGSEPLVRETPAAAIRRGAESNRLGVIAQGDRFQLFINGEPVADVRDDRRPWGQLGWAAGTPTPGAQVEARFTNLAVATAAPAELLAPLLRGQ